MRKNSRRKTDRELDDTRVKMYKTHHGWVSCLTRFFHLLSFGSKEEVQAEQFIDKDSIKEQRAMSTDAYLKGLGLLSTLLGVGGYQPPPRPPFMQQMFLLTRVHRLLGQPQLLIRLATFSKAQLALHLAVIQRVRRRLQIVAVQLAKLRQADRIRLALVMPTRPVLLKRVAREAPVATATAVPPV
ncbi:serine-rich glycoprotein adhesin [Limosilactobacillus antri]|uniref:serine-rich glycoprotein adhesin n=1 Tax=Limosilactobacillus antri TaxID=227943 RepID=UPI001F5810F8|nr:serine-rich glycoprotein adhesin [Limosilactobacillus antri]